MAVVLSSIGVVFDRERKELSRRLINGDGALFWVVERVVNSGETRW